MNDMKSILLIPVDDDQSTDSETDYNSVMTNYSSINRLPNGMGDSTPIPPYISAYYISSPRFLSGSFIVTLNGSSFFAKR